MHDYQLHKGKLNKLLGNITLTNKTNLISFLKFEIEHNDLRTFLILKTKDADFVIQITDEGAAILHQM